ncbi:MAG TPA: carboxypeptidase regulatory-like domain-containing protein [Bryobacteraceae bacterium]|nr:carboxypeptidase regulatory-like domain-containing protein [Bryobacteraceae bacterium]
MSSKCARRILPVLLLLTSLQAGAQVARSFITGTVGDMQGNRIPGAKVRAIEATTGLKRETETNSQGTYSLVDLPVGKFRIEIEKPGFTKLCVNNVVQEVGQTRTIDATLSLASRTDEAEVTEAMVQLDRVDATVGSPIEATQVDELPINGRNWATLTSLVPGALDNGAGDQRTIRFAGHGLDDNNVTLDGVDATAVYNQEQREYVRLTIPLDSIQEFDVKDQTFGADVEGGTAGGQVAVVSPSGTNSFHGNLFDYFRNDAIEARTPFNGPSPNPFLLNQFGAGVGGPIKKDKWFFYANYEGLRQRLDGTQIGLVPSPSFIAQASLMSPALIPILRAFPAGTSPTAKPNVWNYDAPGRQVDNEDSGMIRIDYHYSDKTTAFIRYNADEAVETTPAGNLTALTGYDTKFNNGEVELLHVFSPIVVNEAKFGIDQDNYHSGTISPTPYTISVSGFSSLAGDTTSDYPSKSISALDDVSWSKGNHTLKFGFEAKRFFLNQGSSSSGTLTYTSTGNFLNNLMGTASYTALLPLVRQRKTEYFAYAEDEWKVNQNLTINAGVRYNIFNALHAVNNDDVPFDFETCGGFCPRTYSYFNPRYNDIDPRVGIAWSHGQTVVRIGAGIYHTDGQLDDQNLPISNTVDRYSFTNTSFPGLAYPLLPFLTYAENGGLGVVSPRDLQRNRKDDYVAAWTFSLQQTLPFKLIGTASYLGNKATDVLTTTYTNLAVPPQNLVPYPQFGAVSWRGDVGNSTFEALQINVRRAFQNGFLLTSNYTWSHSINDDSIGGGESDTPQDSFCRACDKASSDDDIRSAFNLSAVYQLPFGAGKQYLSSPGVARAVFSNWEVSAIATAQTGLPVNITVDRANSAVPGLFSISGEERPNYVYGMPLTPVGGSTPNDWINIAAFAVPANQTFGNLGRNDFRAPGISQLDLGLSKFVTVTERTNIRLRADLFNVFNRAQFGAPNSDISQGNFGIITSTISNYASGRGTPRELQLSAKIVF